MAKQVNIFVENKPGRLMTITETLYMNKINMRAMTIQDRGDFGMMKLLVDKPEAAAAALSEKGFAAALKDVLAIIIDDRPGGLFKLLQIFNDKKINIQDSYGFVIESKKKAVLCVEVKDPDAIKETVEKAGFGVLTDAQLYDL